MAVDVSSGSTNDFVWAFWDGIETIDTHPSLDTVDPTYFLTNESLGPSRTSLGYGLCTIGVPFIPSAWSLPSYTSSAKLRSKCMVAFITPSMDFQRGAEMAFRIADSMDNDGSVPAFPYDPDTDDSANTRFMPNSLYLRYHPTYLKSSAVLAQPSIAEYYQPYGKDCKVSWIPVPSSTTLPASWAELSAFLPSRTTVAQPGSIWNPYYGTNEYGCIRNRYTNHSEGLWGWRTPPYSNIPPNSTTKWYGGSPDSEAIILTGTNHNPLLTLGHDEAILWVMEIDFTVTSSRVSGSKRVFVTEGSNHALAYINGTYISYVNMTASLSGMLGVYNTIDFNTGVTYRASWDVPRLVAVETDLFGSVTFESEPIECKVGSVYWLGVGCERNGSNPFSGSIRWFQMGNQAFSATDVTRYNARTSPNPPHMSTVATAFATLESDTLLYARPAIDPDYELKDRGDEDNPKQPVRVAIYQEGTDPTYNEEFFLDNIRLYATGTLWEFSPDNGRTWYTEKDIMNEAYSCFVFNQPTTKVRVRLSSTQMGDWVQSFLIQPLFAP